MMEFTQVVVVGPMVVGSKKKASCLVDGLLCCGSDELHEEPASVAGAPASTPAMNHS